MQEVLDLRLSRNPDGFDWQAVLSDRCEVGYGDRLTGPLLKSAKQISMLGNRSNADLICAVFESHPQLIADRRLRLGTPAVCSADDWESLPKLWLRFEQLATMSASIGGWHVATDHDYRAYDLVRKYHRASAAKRFTRECRASLAAHPAWAALSFITPLDGWSAAGLLATIIDPRWYVDPRYPNRRAKLRSFLGLTQKNLQFRPRLDTRYGERAYMTAKTWDGYASKPSNEAGTFLWRIVGRTGYNAKGRLRACAAFINYLTENWLTAITGLELFVPDYFFTAKEAAVFQQHMQRAGRAKHK